MRAVKQRPRHVNDPAIWPNRVRHLVELWRGRAPDDADLGFTAIFPAASYRYVLNGLDWIGDVARARAAALDVTPPAPSPRFDARRGELLHMLPSHVDYLAAIASASRA